MDIRIGDYVKMKNDDCVYRITEMPGCSGLFPKDYRGVDESDGLCGLLNPRDIEGVVPRPDPRQVENTSDLPKMAIMVNPHEAPLHYGDDHLGREIEVIEWLPDESCYVVRFDWGLGVLHDSMVDFGLHGVRTKEQREREELIDLISHHPIYKNAVNTLADDILSRYTLEPKP